MNQNWVYPRFLRRFQAVTIDSIMLSILFMGLLLILTKWGIMGRNGFMITVVIVMLWEPLWVSITGASVGHHLIGLRIVNKSTGRNLNIVASFFRFILKMCLGIPSLVFIFITRYHQALHDGIAHSVVILNHPERKPSYESLPARQVELAGYTYPSVLRRSIMIVVYNGALIYLIGTITGYLLPVQCLINSYCTIQQEIMLTTWQLIWLVGLVLIIIFCWTGRLLGCRKKRITGE
jgi:uncharacterized RDD family membrane protein YckC